MRGYSLALSGAVFSTSCTVRVETDVFAVQPTRGIGGGLWDRWGVRPVPGGVAFTKRSVHPLPNGCTHSQKRAPTPKSVHPLPKGGRARVCMLLGSRYEVLYCFPLPFCVGRDPGMELGASEQSPQADRRRRRGPCRVPGVIGAWKQADRQEREQPQGEGGAEK